MADRDNSERRNPKECLALVRLKVRVGGRAEKKREVGLASSPICSLSFDADVIPAMKHG